MRYVEGIKKVSLHEYKLTNEKDRTKKVNALFLGLSIFNLATLSSQSC